MSVKLGLSFVSVEQARRNLAREQPDWDFDAAASRAAGEWAKALERIAVEGGTRCAAPDLLLRPLPRP